MATNLATVMNPGDRVQYTVRALQPAREFYLGLGDDGRKRRAQADYERQRNARGTILAVSHTPSLTYTVLWDDGVTSYILSYLLEVMRVLEPPPHAPAPGRRGGTPRGIAKPQDRGPHWV